ncbi:hypothetical protein F4677DRAFT_416810 [Hypoxylon crocopeplum]|nr:hypothetical protein F4677DRAFT_416810 [Hypoxylon crocopeplum]
MMEYFTFKKVKKHREEKAEKQRLEKEEKSKEKGKGKEIEDTAKAPSTDATSSATPSSTNVTFETAQGTPILDQEDEKFLERLTSPSDSNFSNDDDETPPPLPPRVKTPVIELDSDASSFASKDDSSSIKQAATTKKDNKGKDKDKSKDGDETHKSKRFSFVTNLSRNISLKRKPGKHPHQEHDQHLTVPTSDPDPQRSALNEETDIARVLEDLNLAASTDNKAFSLSRESAETLRKFTQVLKDLVNGVPTAYSDLVNLIEDRDNVLARSYEKMPRSLKKLVAQLPEKLTSSLAPELLAVAAEAQGLAAVEEEGGKKLLSVGNLMDLVTKPGAVVGLLKGIVNALKVRWPAFVGTNVLWSVAVFLLLSMLWYCYKRGRETRLEREASEATGTAVVEEVEEGEGEGKKELMGVDGDTPRIEEVLDGPGPQQLTVPAPPVAVAAPASSSEGKKE